MMQMSMCDGQRGVGRVGLRIGRLDGGTTKPKLHRIRPIKGMLLVFLLPLGNFVQEELTSLLVK